MKTISFRKIPKVIFRKQHQQHTIMESEQTWEPDGQGYKSQFCILVASANILPSFTCNNGKNSYPWNCRNKNNAETRMLTIGHRTFSRIESFYPPFFLLFITTQKWVQHGTDAQYRMEWVFDWKLRCLCVLREVNSSAWVTAEKEGIKVT
jgi:hypothetical protein